MDDSQRCDLCGETFPSEKFKSHLLSHIESSVGSLCDVTLNGGSELATHMVTRASLRNTADVTHNLCDDSDVINSEHTVTPSVETKCKVDPAVKQECLSVDGLEEGMADVTEAAINVQVGARTRKGRRRPKERKEPSHQCIVCHKPFTRKLSLAKHMKTHSETESVTRDVDSSVTVSSQKSGCREKLHLCSVCGKVCPRKSGLDNHMKTHIATEGVEVGSRKRWHPPEQSHECGECGEVFNRKMMLTKHLLQRHTYLTDDYDLLTKRHQCSLCVRSFEKDSSYRRHLRLDHGVVRQPIPVQCSECGKFMTVDSLKRHMKCYHYSSPHQCATCNQVFKRYSHLKNHQRQQDHGNLIIHSQSAVCSICGIVSKRASKLKIHMLVHIEDRPYQCNLCDKLFKTQSSLTLHQGVHLKVKEYQCEVCEKRFVKKSSMQCHYRAHFDERTHFCSVCSKSCFTAAQLKLHMRIHAGIHAGIQVAKSFGCTFCDKKFNRKGNMQLHVRTHTGEKPFECGVCKKRFADASNCTKHENSHSVSDASS